MSNKLITVATLEHINQADMMKGWLDSAGIESSILDHGLSVENATQMEGQVELQVREEDVLNALEIINSVNNAENAEKKNHYIINQLI